MRGVLIVMYGVQCSSSSSSIGYPVVTMSFLIKHQIMHVIRQRQQKKIAEENSFYFDILQKALPQEPSKQAEENEKDKTSVEDGSASVSNSHSQHSDHRDGRPKISPKASHSSGSGGGGGSGKNSNRERTSSSSGKHSRSGGSRAQDHRSNSSKAQSSQSTNEHHNHQSTHGAAMVAAPNGDLPRPSSAGKVHVVGGKKQLAVKAVPRSNEPSQTATTVPTGNTLDSAKDKVSERSGAFSYSLYWCLFVCSFCLFVGVYV